MANACHEGLIAKFDQIITKLQQRIMHKARLEVTENGTYTAPENTGYTVVDVNVQAGAPVDTRTQEPITITENGVTNVPDDKVYTPITVDVPQPTLTEYDYDVRGGTARAGATSFLRPPNGSDGFSVVRLHGNLSIYDPEKVIMGKPMKEDL